MVDRVNIKVKTNQTRNNRKKGVDDFRIPGLM